ncbi:MAG: glycosyltransferase [Oscillospiraceae bacterium]|nr:glycosyltransferase [Oscillospiraceae bacterium]
MKIYFIIPVFKTEKYLPRCIDSVLRQTYRDTEIILVDDGSPDGSPEICDEYKKNYPNVTVIHKENGGLSSARNAGLDYLDGIAAEDDYITFLDSDDFVREEFAERMISLCESFGAKAGQCGYEKGEADMFSAPAKKVAETAADAETMLLNRDLKSQSCAKIYQKALFRDIRFPVGVLNEDEFTTYRIIYAAETVFLTDEKLYYYFQHPNSIMSGIKKNMKGSPHLMDWMNAYRERIDFFTEQNKPIQVQRTREKICTDAILRYCEQKHLKKEDRDELSRTGRYLKIYRENFPKMITRRGISLRRRLMYVIFYIAPFSAVRVGTIFGKDTAYRK